MTKRMLLLLAAILMMVVNQPSLVFSETAEEVMEKVALNIRGPNGTILVASGRMRLVNNRASDICVGRAVDDNNGLHEASQTDLLSPSSGQSGVESGGTVLRFIREGDKVNALSYLTSLRRGRKIAWDPMTGILGGDFKHELLLPVSNIRGDFTYQFSGEDGLKIIGTRKEGNRSPFENWVISLEKKGDVYVVVESVYTYTNGGPKNLTQTYGDYREVVGAPGYWAPLTTTVGDTTIKFDQWQSLPLSRAEWLFSVSNGGMGTNQMVPCQSLVASR